LGGALLLKPNKFAIDWLLFLIALLGAVVLIGLYYLLKPDHSIWYKELAFELIPHFLSLIAVSILAFLVLYRIGQTPEQRVDSAIQETLRQSISEILGSFNFYPRGDELDWVSEIENASGTVRVAAYYIGESWFTPRREAFATFLSRKQSKLMIYLPDCTDDSVLGHTFEVYGGSKDESDLRNRVSKTATMLGTFLTSRKIHKGRVQLKKVKCVLNVNLILINERRLVMEYFEVMDKSTGSHFDVPAFAFDLEHYPQLRRFAVEQFRALESLGSSVQL